MYIILAWIPTIIVLCAAVGAFFQLRQMTIDLKETMGQISLAVREQAAQGHEDRKHIYGRIEAEQTARINEDKEIRKEHLTLQQCELRHRSNGRAYGPMEG